MERGDDSAQPYRCSLGSWSGSDCSVDEDGAGLQSKLPTEPTYMDIVILQAFSGEWKLTAELAQALGTTLEALQNAAPVKGLNVWATVLALSYLEAKYSEKRDEWEMIEMKARQWLALQDLEGMTVDELLQKARAMIGQK